MPEQKAVGSWVSLNIVGSDSSGISENSPAPSADAGDGGEFAVGSSVTLDGSGSTDPDGSITRYSWTQTARRYSTGDDSALPPAGRRSPTQGAWEFR